MKILIETILHSAQRYDTCGDWQPNDCLGWNIKVSELSSDRLETWREEFLIAMHELIEAAICRVSGVTSTEVDQWDTMYEKIRTSQCPKEPGDHPVAPYHSAHQKATAIEHLLAVILGVDWSSYKHKIDQLSQDIPNSQDLDDGV